MPSSSSRSSSLELELHRLYKLAYARLWYSNLRNHAKFITLHFAALLDYDPSDLIGTIKPGYHPDRDTFEAHVAELKVWQDFRNLVLRTRKSENIHHAGNALADTSAVLFKAGMSKEANAFCDWSKSMLS